MNKVYNFANQLGLITALTKPRKNQMMIKSNFQLILYILIPIVLLSNRIHSQDSKEVYKHDVFWHKTEINELFNYKWGVGLDFVYRSKNELQSGSMFDSHLRTSIRPWVHYQFSPNARLSFAPIGYMYTNEYVGTEQDLGRLPYHELRTTLQFLHHYKHFDGRVMHTWRYRYEFRWQEQPLLDEYRYFTRFRFRYRVRVLFNSRDFYQDKTIYTAISNEIGINIGSNVVLNTFNQNRLYLGLGVRFLNSARLELRYVDRFRARGATGFEFDHGRGFMVGLYIDQLSAIGSKQEQKVRFSD